MAGGAVAGRAGRRVRVGPSSGSMAHMAASGGASGRQGEAGAKSNAVPRMSCTWPVFRLEGRPSKLFIRASSLSRSIPLDVACSPLISVAGLEASVGGESLVGAASGGRHVGENAGVAACAVASWPVWPCHRVQAIRRGDRVDRQSPLVVPWVASTGLAVCGTSKKNKKH